MSDLPERLRKTIQPGNYLTSNAPNRLLLEAATVIEVALTTLEQIATTPRNAGAKRNANATLRFIETNLRPNV